MQIEHFQVSPKTGYHTFMSDFIMRLTTAQLPRFRVMILQSRQRYCTLVFSVVDHVVIGIMTQLKKVKLCMSL